MSDAHQVVINYICKIVGRISIRFNQDHVIQFRVIDGNISVDLIVEGSSSCLRVILTDNIRNTCF